jgi:hypothetical protein
MRFLNKLAETLIRKGIEMKKTLFIFVLAVVIATGTVFADHPNNKIGIGIVGLWHGGWDGSRNYGGALSLKVPSMPIFWTVRVGFDTQADYFSFGLSGDKYFIDKALIQEIKLHWFVGLGGYVYLDTWKDSNITCGIGARVPIGLSWHIVDVLELFLDIAPSLGMRLIPPLHFPDGGFPVELGIRLWL